MSGMSPGAALDSIVFMRYLIFAGVLLGLAGLILAVLRFGLGKNVASIARTYRGWWIMAPLIFGAIFAALSRNACVKIFAHPADVQVVVTFGTFVLAGKRQ